MPQATLRVLIIIVIQSDGDTHTCLNKYQWIEFPDSTQTQMLFYAIFLLAFMRSINGLFVPFRRTVVRRPCVPPGQKTGSTPSFSSSSEGSEHLLLPFVPLMPEEGLTPVSWLHSLTLSRETGQTH